MRVRVRALRDVLDRPFDLPMIRNRRDGFCILPPEGKLAGATQAAQDRDRRAAQRPGAALHAS